jgi:hypothetical protein
VWWWLGLFNLFHFEVLILNRNPKFRSLSLFVLTFHEYKARLVFGWIINFPCLSFYCFAYKKFFRNLTYISSFKIDFFVTLLCYYMYTVYLCLKTYSHFMWIIHCHLRNIYLVTIIYFKFRYIDDLPSLNIYSLIYFNIFSLAHINVRKCYFLKITFDSIKRYCFC